MPAEKTAFRRRVTPSVPFTLKVEDANGDKWSMSFRLCFDLNNLCLFEEVTSINFIQEMGSIITAPSVRTLTTLLWAGSQETYPGYEGLQAIRANVTLADLKDVKDACIKALLCQLPEEARARLEALLAGEALPADPTQVPA